MENVAETLKIAFAIMVLILALTLTLRITSQAKETADAVFFVSDESNFYDMSSIKEKISDKEKNDGYRVVNADTVVSNLYRLYGESMIITIDDKTYDSSSYKTSKEAYLAISEAIKDYNYSTGTYVERYQEITVSGIYKYGEDGSELTITPGATKMYITYIKI